MSLRSNIVAALLFLTFLSNSAIAAPTKYNMSGKVKACSGCKVLLVQRNGTTKFATLGNSGSFSFKKLTLSQLKKASLNIVDGDGNFAGPVVLATKGSNASVTFSGKANNSAAFQLGPITRKEGYATLKKHALNKVAYSKPTVPTVNGRPAGAGNLGLTLSSTPGAIRVKAEDGAQNPGDDADSDGIVAAFDADDDGDLIPDNTDSDARGQDIPYTGFYFDFRQTLNANVRSGLTDEVIDAAISGENIFSLTFFISLAPNQSNIDGGHVVCDDSQVYCRQNTPVGYYGGVSESSEEFRNHPWSELLTSDGYPRMERISVGGNPAIVASIQPRVSRAQFQPGHVYLLRLTEGNTVVSTRSLALAPYPVSIPAVSQYDAGFGPVTVDYDAVTADSGSIPGIIGNPIVLSDDGNLTITMWRPQRAAVGSDESGFYDWGNLNYGVVIEQAQATCAGFYSGLSSDLTEDSSALGEGDSPFAQNGANISPLRDSQGDRAANSANTLSFTVNLKNCLARAGLSPGEHTISLRAAGEEVTGGQISAVQSISVQIP